MYACTPNAESDEIRPRSVSNNSEEEECINCYNNYIIKGSGGQATTFGSFRVCEENVEGVQQLCFTYTASEGRKINAIDLGFYVVQEDGTLYPLVSLTPSPNNFQITKRDLDGSTISFCVNISDIAAYLEIEDLSGKSIVIATNAIVTGSRGENPGGQGWVGELTLDGKYPFDRTFRFTFCGEDNGGGDSGCNKTQGYWKTHGSGFCGNGNNDNFWPVTGGLTLGNVPYTNDQLCSILNALVGTGKKANGLISLAHQLIAAKLNQEAYGTTTPFIAQADAMIGNLIIPPVGQDRLTTAQVYTLVEGLTSFNESGACAR